MRLKQTMLSLVLIVGLLLGNGALYSPPTPAAAYLPDNLPAARPAPQAPRQIQAAVFPVIADFEGGVPDGWFVYGDWGNITIDTTIPTVGDTDPLALPGQIGNNDVLSMTTNVPTWAGFGAPLNPAQDWSDYDALSFWFYGENLSTTHEIEIQTATAGNRRATFVDDFAGWRKIILPFSTFGAGGAYDVSQVTNWVFVLDGTVGAFKLDHLELVNLVPFADFEGGVPAGWFVYGDWGNITIDTTIPTIGDTDPLALPGQIGNNDVLSMTANVPSWAGFGAPLTADWSDMQGVSFWYYGEELNTTHEFEIQTLAAGNRRATFVDDFAGWRLITLPFSAFGDGSAYDVSQVTNWVFVLDGTVGSFKLDYLNVYGDAGNVTRRVQFETAEYAVEEGNTATITVTLNMTATYPVTVTYATSDGTAVAGTDYTATTGSLVFPPDTLTQSFTVETVDNDSEDGARTVLLTLSDPVDVELGALSQATLFIEDNEAVDFCRRILMMVDDFEDGLLPAGQDGIVDIGFVTWSDGSAVSIITQTIAASDPEAMTGQVGDNIVVQFDANIGSWGGFSHLFMNEAGDTWISQDWSRYAGIGFWLYGEGDGTGLFFEFKENRNAGSTTDDAEIWTYPFSDNVAGWRYIEIPFGDFYRKEIGNGAPNDGLTLEEVHGWAFGSTATGGDQTLYFDNVVLLERVTVVDDFEGGLPTGFDAYGNGIGFVVWGNDWDGTTFGIANPLIDAADPLALPCQTGINHLLQLDSNVVPNGWAGMSHAFENEAMDTWITQDWSSYEGVSFWVYGTNGGAALFFDITDNRNPGSTGDDAERFSYAFTDDFTGWQLFTIPFTDFVRKDIGNGAPNDGFTLTEVHGWSFGSLTSSGAQTHYLDYVMLYGDTREPDLAVAFAAPGFSVNEGETAELIVALNREHDAPVTVEYTTAEANARPYQYTPVSGTLTFPAGTLTQTINIPTYHDGKHTRDVRVAVNLYEGNLPLGFQRRAILTIVDLDPAAPNLLDDFEGYHPFIYQEGDVTLASQTLMASDPLAVPGQLTYEDVLAVELNGTASFSRTFSQGQDWSAHDGLSFWFYGQNSGEAITLELHENMAATTAEVDPAEWVLVWSDEFNDPVGTAPNANVWKFEVGDGALNGIVGWGNSEFQYYTDSTENSFTDGLGNLVIRLQAADPADGLVCWYGECDYTSARLLTQDRLDFEYGRIEARVLVPDGPGGLWPAFWMLGTDIPDVGWPQSGEIDIMEYVSRIPNEIFGTIHGPGYAGGVSFGNIYDFGEPVANEYHTYAVDWSPNLITWYVDDIQYHEAIPDDVAPNEWVFNHPFFMLLNAAIGGNFGGEIAGSMTMPQDTLVDYVRVYQAADTAERFEAAFADDFTGWRKVFVPFSDFTRSAEQPAGAPDDGLTLTEVWGYGFSFPEGSSGMFYLDQVRLSAPPEDPAISVMPESLAETADEGSTIVLTQTLIVSNTGDVALTWSIEITPATATWLMFTIGESEQTVYLPGLSIAPGNHEIVTVYFDPTGLEPGEYTAYLHITTNDPLHPTVMIPVTFTIEAEATDYLIHLPLVLRNNP